MKRNHIIIRRADLPKWKKNCQYVPVFDFDFEELKELNQFDKKSLIVVGKYMNDFVCLEKFEKVYKKDHYS